MNRTSPSTNGRGGLIRAVLAVAVTVLLHTQVFASPCINVTKTCQDAAAPGDPITFSGQVTNCSDSRTLTEVTVVDDHTTPPTVLGPITLYPYESADFSGSYVPMESPSTNTVTASGVWTSGTYSETVTATASSTCEVPTQGLCWLTAGGVKFSPLANDMMAEYNGPKDNVGGNVYPGCSPDAGDGGSWTHIDHELKLHFHGTDISVVRCGNVPGIPSGSESPVTPFNFIEFTGTGSLAGIASNRNDFGTVCFFARAEDRNEPGNEKALLPDGGADVDRYFMRVYNCDTSDSLLLVDDGSGNPRPITGGNFQIHISSCDN